MASTASIVSRIKLLLPLGVVAVVAAACSGDQGGGASGAATGSASATASASVAAGPSTSAAQATPVAQAPSTQPGAGELDDVLPDEVAGLTMEYQSTTGEDLFSEAAGGGEAFFEAVGADASDVSAAFGLGRDPGGEAAVSIVAFRVSGVAEEVLREEFLATLEAQAGTAEEANVGGKDVLEIHPAVGESVSYLYVTGDVIYVIASDPLDLAEEALAALP